MLKARNLTRVCLQTFIMWNGTKVILVGSCALPVVSPKTNEKCKVRFIFVERI